MNQTQTLTCSWCEQHGHDRAHCPWTEAANRCPHPASERTHRTGHGYLSDYAAGEVHELCGGCGHDFDAHAAHDTWPLISAPGTVWCRTCQRHFKAVAS